MEKILSSYLHELIRCFWHPSLQFIFQEKARSSRRQLCRNHERRLRFLERVVVPTTQLQRSLNPCCGIDFCFKTDEEFSFAPLLFLRKLNSILWLTSWINVEAVVVLRRNAFIVELQSVFTVNFHFSSSRIGNFVEMFGKKLEVSNEKLNF